MLPQHGEFIWTFCRQNVSKSLFCPRFKWLIWKSQYEEMLLPVVIQIGLWEVDESANMVCWPEQTKELNPFCILYALIASVNVSDELYFPLFLLLTLFSFPWTHYLCCLSVWFPLSQNLRELILPLLLPLWIQFLKTYVPDLYLEPASSKRIRSHTQTNSLPYSTAEVISLVQRSL